MFSGICPRGILLTSFCLPVTVVHLGLFGVVGCCRFHIANRTQRTACPRQLETCDRPKSYWICPRRRCGFRSRSGVLSGVLMLLTSSCCLSRAASTSRNNLKSVEFVWLHRNLRVCRSPTELNRRLQPGHYAAIPASSLHGVSLATASHTDGER